MGSFPPQSSHGSKYKLLGGERDRQPAALLAQDGPGFALKLSSDLSASLTTTLVRGENSRAW